MFAVDLVLPLGLDHFSLARQILQLAGCVELGQTAIEIQQRILRCERAHSYVPIIPASGKNA